MNQSRPITPEMLAGYERDFRADPRNALARNAVTASPLHKVALNHSAVIASDQTFSVMLDEHEVTSQEKSGRCWLFAGLNILRTEAMKNMKLEKFELSQNHLMFWDKFEKANYFYESVLATLAEPIDGRLLMFLLRDPVQDGGQWDMFANLVKKYGVMPKTAMPETESSSNTGLMTELVTTQLREDAAELRRLGSAGKSAAELRDRKNGMLGLIYRMLAIHLGEPPREFLWQWRDKDKQFHRAGVVTPGDFFRQYVGFDLDAMACLIHCPTRNKPFRKMYTIEYLGNVVEGDIIRYLNVEMDVFKAAAVAMLQAGKPVWFGCDVGKMLERKLGILDMSLYDYSSVYGAPFRADKAERIDYGHSVMTHAMVFSGVDLDDAGTPRKWRVENSWGEKIGAKGYMVMTDSWFDEYLYEIAVDKQFLPPSLLPALETDPVRLPPWDPMGSLAASAPALPDQGSYSVELPVHQGTKTRSRRPLY